MTDAVGVAQALVRVPSVNCFEGDVDESHTGEAALTDALERLLHELGIPCVRQPVPPRGENVIAYVESPGAKRTVLFDAHQDTVPVEGMTISPFTGELRDGRLWGRGACDVKGGMAAMIAAMGRLIAERPRGAANVVLSCTVDEEHTFRGVKRLLNGPWPLGAARPDFAITAEPTRLRIVIAHKGLTRWKIKTEGKSAHGASPELGVNAVYLMAPVISTLEEYARSLTAGPRHPLLGPASLSVGTIKGGTSVNTVPAFCEVELDSRLIPGQTPQSALAECRHAVLSRVGAGFPVTFQEPWIAEPALDTPPDSQVAQVALGAVSRVMGEASACGVPYGTNASTLSAGGIPAVVLGPGDIAQAHTQDEWIDVRQIEAAAEVYYQIAVSAE